MKKNLNFSYILALFFFIFCGYANAKTEQDMLLEYNRWVEILGPDVDGVELKPARIIKHRDSWSGEMVIRLIGTINLLFDNTTGELMRISNMGLGNMRAAEFSQGKTVQFTLDKEDFQAVVSKYFKLIAGEELPDVGGLLENTLPRQNERIRPSHFIRYKYPRIHEGYRFRDDQIVLSLFAMDGKFFSYNNFHRSNPPATVEVKISEEQARQKAIELADKEIKAWVSFLDSVSEEAERAQVRDSELRRKYGLNRETLKEEGQKAGSLVGVAPKIEGTPYLEIVNLQRDAFHPHYYDPEWYRKSRGFNPDTRLSWIVNLSYRNEETGASAQFEVWIDAYDGSFVGGYRPWD